MPSCSPLGTPRRPGRSGSAAETLQRFTPAGPMRVGTCPPAGGCAVPPAPAPAPVAAPPPAPAGAVPAAGAAAPVAGAGGVDCQVSALPPLFGGATGLAGVAADPPVPVLGTGASPPARVSCAGRPAYCDGS